jgi:hypothetical protein
MEKASKATLSRLPNAIARPTELSNSRQEELRKTPNAALTRTEPVEIASAVLNGGRVVEVNEHPHDPTRTVLAVGRGAIVRFLNRVEDNGRIFVPMRRDSEFLKHVSLPRGVLPYESLAALMREAGTCLASIVPMSTATRNLLGAIAVCTWITFRLASLPLPIIVGPPYWTLPLMRALRGICYRGLLVGKATTAGILAVYSRIRPTLLIVNYGIRSDARQILELGTQRDVFALQGTGLVSPFGLNIIATLDSGAFEHNGDYLRIHLEPFGRPQAGKLSDPQWIQQADSLQQKLQQLRFDELASAGNSRTPPSTPGMRGLSEGARQIVAPFLADETLGRELIDAVKTCGGVVFSRLPSRQRAVLAAMFNLVHEKGRECFLVGEAATLANQFLGDFGEAFNLTPKRVGKIMSDLGFKANYRVDRGLSLELEEEVAEGLHRCAKFYGIDEIHPGMTLDVRCKLCRDFELLPKRYIEHFEKDELPEIERRKREKQAAWEKRQGREALRQYPPRPLPGPGFPKDTPRKA